MILQARRKDACEDLTVRLGSLERQVDRPAPRRINPTQQQLQMYELAPERRRCELFGVAGLTALKLQRDDRAISAGQQRNASRARNRIEAPPEPVRSIIECLQRITRRDLCQPDISRDHGQDVIVEGSPM